jgi:curli biogenesis system outer membrane secretion channel CsgG
MEEKGGGFMIRWIFGMLAAVWMFSGAALAAPLPAERPVVAVIPFGVKAAVSRDITLEDATIVSDYVYDALVNSDSFDVVERERLKEILSEQALGHSGPVNESTAAEFGRLIGAKYIICGSITGLSTRKTTGELVGIGVSQSKVYAHVSARCIDVETGRIWLAGRGDGRATNTQLNAPLRIIRIGTDKVDFEQVHKALEDAADSLVNGKKGFLKRMRDRERRDKE